MELGEIQKTLGLFERDFSEETKAMDGHLDKLLKNPTDDYKYLAEGITNYLSEIDKLATDANYLKEERDECFEDFDEEVPAAVRDARGKKGYSSKKSKGTTTTQATDT